MALLLIVHTWNSSPLRSNLLRLQCTCCTVPTTSRRPHGSPLVWACQWPSSQPLSSPQLSHNDSLGAKGISKSHRKQGLDYREAEELSWCPSWSNSLWQGWSCGLVHYPGGNVTDPIWRVLASSLGISSWTPLKPQHSIPCWLSVQWEPSACRSCQCCQKKKKKKRDHQKFVGGFDLFGRLGSGRASMLRLGTLSLGVWVIAAFIARYQSIKNCGIWLDQLDHLPAVMTTPFLIFSEYPWDKLRANLPHLQFLANDCVYSSHTDIKLCTHCLYRYRTVFIHEILYLANRLWCSDFLTPPTPLIIPHRLPAFLESLMPLKKWCSIHARCSQNSLKPSICFCGIFSKFKTEFYCISFF